MNLCESRGKELFHNQLPHSATRYETREMAGPDRRVKNQGQDGARENVRHVVSTSEESAVRPRSITQQRESREDPEDDDARSSWRSFGKAKRAVNEAQAAEGASWFASTRWMRTIRCTRTCSGSPSSVRFHVWSRKLQKIYVGTNDALSWTAVGLLIALLVSS
jgi:hypothetical protein